MRALSAVGNHRGRRKRPLLMVWFPVRVRAGPPGAGVAELVDALDLGSSGASCGGWRPSARTIARCSVSFPIQPYASRSGTLLLFRREG